jgi:hypothetical protein
MTPASVVQADRAEVVAVRSKPITQTDTKNGIKKYIEIGAGGTGEQGSGESGALARASY